MKHLGIIIGRHMQSIKNSQPSIIGHLYGQSIHWIVFKPLFNGHRATTASFFCSKGSLRRRRNLTPVNNACEAAPRCLLWDPNGLNQLPEVRLRFPFNLIGKSIIAFFNGPIMARTQILLYRWGPRTSISVLSRRRTLTSNQS